MRAQNYRLSFFSFNFAIQNQLRGELWKRKRDNGEDKGAEAEKESK